MADNATFFFQEKIAEMLERRKTVQNGGGAQRVKKHHDAGLGASGGIAS